LGSFDEIVRPAEGRNHPKSYGGIGPEQSRAKAQSTERKKTAEFDVQE
jgi:hypothetical protein